MTDSKTDFAAHAGYVVFPRADIDLRSTGACPACFTPLRAAVCRKCALDLSHPAASHLFTISADAANILDLRLRLIGQIRYESERAAAVPDVAVPVAASAADHRAPRPLPPPVVPPTSGITPPGIVPPAFMPPALVPQGLVPPGLVPPGFGHPPDAMRARRSSVQVVLLVVGVSLLSIAAVFFLVFAFVTFGIVGRSIVIGAITLAAIAAASVLRRRRLTATAEGVAVFAAVLVYLDAFALRANDLFGLAAVPAATYWGLILLGSTAGFFAWHQLSALRTPSIVAFAALGPGAALLVGGLAAPFDGVTRTFAALAALGLVGLLHPIATVGLPSGAAAAYRLVERLILVAGSCVGLICAFFLALAVEPSTDTGSAAALAVVATIALGHVVVAARGADDADPTTRSVLRNFAVGAACLGAAAAAAIGIALALRLESLAFGVFWPGVSAVAIALLLEFAARRVQRPSLVGPAFAGSVTAAIVAGIASTLTVMVAALPTLAALRTGIAPGAAGIATTRAEPELAVAAIAVVTLLTAAVWAGSGVLRARAALLAWAAAATVLLAVPLPGPGWLAAVGWLVVAAIGLTALLPAGIVTAPPVRLALGTSALAAAALGFFAAWAADGWWWGSLATIALLFVARAAAPASATVRPAARAALLGAATLIALAAAGALAGEVGASPAGSDALALDWLRFVGIAATVLTVAASVTPSMAPAVLTRADISPLDRRIIFWITTPVAAATLIASRSTLFSSPGDAIGGSAILAEPVTALVLSAALLGALLAWVGLAPNARFRAERIAASAAVAPVVYALVLSFTGLLELAGLAGFGGAVAPVTAALLVSAGALVLSVIRPSASPRWAREFGIAVVGVPAVFVAVSEGAASTWLVLVLGGLTALILAGSADGLFSSASPRKHLGWLALALVAAGLWWRLHGSELENLGAYVLPLAGILLVLARLVRRASAAGPLLALSGSLVGILPLAVNAAAGTLLPAVTVGLVSAGLLLFGTWVVAPVRMRPYLDAAAISGTIGVIATTVGRAATLTGDSGGRSGTALDAWLGSAFAVLVVAAFGMTRHDLSRARSSAAQALAAAAMGALLVFEVANLDAARVGELRAVAVILVFSAIHVVAFAVVPARSPFTPAVGWLAIAFAGAAASAAVVTGAADPLEMLTAPIALALIASGVVQLARLPRARSWPYLGPATAVLLLPSLLATAAERPLWRLVALGVFAVAVLVIGAARRLQAPFVIGAAVSLIHGVATFSSEIRAVYEAVPWWLWLGFGGVLLIVLAARYEQRIGNLRSVALRVTALR